MSPRVSTYVASCRFHAEVSSIVRVNRLRSSTGGRTHGSAPYFSETQALAHFFYHEIHERTRKIDSTMIPLSCFFVFFVVVKFDFRSTFQFSVNVNGGWRRAAHMIVGQSINPVVFSYFFSKRKMPSPPLTVWTV